MSRNLKWFSWSLLENPAIGGDQSSELQIMSELIAKAAEKDYFKSNDFLQIMKNSQEWRNIANMTRAVGYLYSNDASGWIMSIRDILRYDKKEADEYIFLNASQDFALGLMLGIFQLCNEFFETYNMVYQHMKLEVQGLISDMICRDEESYLVKKTFTVLTLKESQQQFNGLYAPAIRKFTRNLKDFDTFMRFIDPIYGKFIEKYPEEFIYYREPHNDHRLPLVTVNNLMAQHGDLSPTSKLILYGRFWESVK